MPAFDPVRDAVLNSPLEQLPGFHLGSATTSPLASPSLTRRATDLSVLLNSSEPPIPTRPRQPSNSSSSSSISNLLSTDNDKLATSEPLNRRYNPNSNGSSGRSAAQSAYSAPAPSSPTRGYHPNYQYSDKESPQLLHRSLGHQQSSSRPSTAGSSTSNTRVGSSGTLRHTSSPSMPPPPTPASLNAFAEAGNGVHSLPPGPPKKSSIPYRPSKRITAPGSVLVPLTAQEMEMYKTYRGEGTRRLSMKRKRSGSDSEEQDRPMKKPAGDVGLVVQHYNSRPDVGVVQRQESPIIGLKNFNNWVKSVLITRFAHPVLQKSSVTEGRPRGGRGKVLDMGCGKGGDMTKWAKAQIRELFCVDIASVSVDQARGRYEGLRNSRFRAQFAALDCYNESLTSAFSPASLSVPFDVVSMQFCMHYAFETERKARCMLDNVARYLRPGGIFIGTIPNAELLYSHLDTIPPEAEELSFGNAVYQIRFEQREPRSIFGHKYWFFLQDAVENVPEYVVHWDNFVDLAADYGLYPIYKEEFHQIFAENGEVPEFSQLLQRMKVVDLNGESSMDEDQWEAANIYIGFAFEKR